MATQRSIVDALLLRVINAVRGHDFLRSAGTQAAPPLQTLTLAPLAPLQTCDSIGHDDLGEQLVASAIPRPQ